MSMSEWDKAISELSNMVDSPPAFMDGTSMTGREAEGF